MLLWLQTTIYVTGWLAGYLSVFLCLVVGFRPRFHSGHLAPSEVSCLKRQTTSRWPHWIFALIQWPPGNVQIRFRHPLPNYQLLIQSVTHAYCIFWGAQEKQTQADVSFPRSCRSRRCICRYVVCWNFSTICHADRQVPSWNYFTRRIKL